jgi:hypothetical protein
MAAQPGSIDAKLNEIMAALSIGGPDICIITIQEGDESPIQATMVWVSLDVLGQQVLTGYYVTNTLGICNIFLEIGKTYYLWATKSGYLSIQGEIFVAAASNIFTMQAMIGPLVEENSYVTIEYADAYLAMRLFNESWLTAITEKKNIALCHATRIIDTLSFRGLKETTDQVLSWPRILESGYDAELPEEIKWACCEIALALLFGINPENEFRNINKTSIGYGALRSSKNTEMVDPHLVNGVPSITAFNFLRPYLTDVNMAIMLRGT